MPNRTHIHPTPIAREHYFTGTITHWKPTVRSYTDYYPFGMEMAERSGRAGSYRYSFQAQETDAEVYGPGNAVSYKYRIHDARLGRFFSVDPLFREYPWNSTYAFSENRLIDGVELEGLEYLEPEEARIKMIGGEAHIDLENCNLSTRKAWQSRNELGGWPTGHIGYPTKIGSLIHPDLPRIRESFHLDNTYGATDPTVNPGTIRVQNPIAKSTGRPNRAFKERTVTGIHPSTRGFAVVSFSLNAVNWSRETYGNLQQLEDIELVSKHTLILNTQVLSDINRAVEIGIIPDFYNNIEDLGNISNVVLSGRNFSGDDKIYEIGIQIVQQISGNYKPPIKPLVLRKISDGVDNTRVDLVIPNIQE